MYRNTTSHSTKAMDPTTLYRFGLSLKRSKGLKTSRMLLPKRQVLYFKVGIAEKISHCYLVLYIMRFHGLILDFYVNELLNGHSRWSQPIKYFRKHASLRYKEVSTFYTRQKLTLLKIHIFHPYSNKLFRLFGTSDPSKEIPEVKKVLDNIIAA